MKFYFSLLFSLLIMLGCANNAHQNHSNIEPSLSIGGMLVVKTNILSLEELKNFESQYRANSHSGLNWDKLSHWEGDFSIDSTLERHPALYPYFFVQHCNTRECVQDKMIELGKDFVKEYIQDKRVVAQNRPFKPVKIIRSDWSVTQAKIEAWDQEPHTLKKKVGVYLRMRHFELLDQQNTIWGNAQAREEQDGFGSYVLDDVERAKMLIAVSRKHPDVITYIGISHTRLKEDAPCFGGFFIQHGKIIEVAELSCGANLVL